ncbi:hypothetical protein J1605_018402 [Eschrichtius robustus]|uniref:PDZ domain-containing protein n=1 Tax=Eschrichtius robustus TaxID=9764 RepID=A0AB34HUD3_ESCRO|nr:hypothetical protein J1605_018402 [Eschrichtius robustus]
MGHGKEAAERQEANISTRIVCAHGEERGLSMASFHDLTCPWYGNRACEGRRQAGRCPSASERRIHLVVSRQLRQQSPDIFQEAGWNSSGSQSPGPGDRSNPPKLGNSGCEGFGVSGDDDLGFSVPNVDLSLAGNPVAVGGTGHLDLGVAQTFVLSTAVPARQSMPVLSAARLLGDVLLNVNGIELTEISRSEAVALLKSTSSSVVLKALEVREREPQEEGSSPAALDSNHRVTAPPGNRSPSWVMWLELPRYLYNCKDVILRRNTAGSLGFCIVGGYEEYNGNKPFFIKSIVEGTPAYNDGRIR